MTAVFKSSRVRLDDSGRFLLVEGTIEEGDVEPGMLLKIDFNPSVGMTVPITQVRRTDGSRVTLILDCIDRDGAGLVDAMNFEDELLEIIGGPSTRVR